MIRSIFAVSVSSFVLVGAAQAETRTYDVAGFTAIDVSAGLDVVFEAGPPQSVTVENKSGDFDDIRVTVKNDTLVLTRAKQMNWGWGKREQYTVTVFAPVLSGVEASSGADIDGSGLSGDIVRIDVSSGADVSVSAIDADEVILDTSSGSDLTASGTCNSVLAESSSGSDIMAKDLVCVSGEADASSGSDIAIHASDRIYADVSSGADVIVYGEPYFSEIDK